MYGFTLLVIVIASSVRPWNALSNTTTAGRPVAQRAIFTAFSTGLGAGVHEDRALLAAAARRELGEAPADLDVRLVDADHEALVEVAVGLLLDRLDDRGVPVTGVLAADPPAKSMNERPSGSVTRAPSACATTSLGVDIPGAT